MAKKKKEDGKLPKRVRKQPAEPSPVEKKAREFPDPRDVKDVVHSDWGGLVVPREATLLHMAQGLMYEAFLLYDPKKRAELAMKALELSPDCADAYRLLAQQTKNPEEALALFESAFAAGQRVLGPKPFQDDVGRFWRLSDTVPYMRAREGLASLLWTMGRRDEAIGHLEDMLRLNPNDDQGVRYTLAWWLLAEGANVDLARLLEQFDENTATWVYTRALLAFRQRGDTSETRELLGLAKEANNHVPAYLLSQKPLPRKRPDHFRPGDQNEAIIYVANALCGWKETPGALAWLRAAEQGKTKSKALTPRSTGPTAAIKAELRRLAQVFDVWQVDFRLAHCWIKIADAPVRPWLVLITSRSEDLVLTHELAILPPGSELLWDVLAKAMGKPAVGDPHRPTELEVRPDERWDRLKPHLDEIGIKVVSKEELDHSDAAFEGLARHLARSAPPGLLEMPGIDAEKVASFYRAAAGFYRRAPWRKLGDETAIKVECDRFESGPWYAVVMGQSGVTFGLALYDDLTKLEKLWADEMSDKDYARETVTLSVTFEDQSGIHVADLDAGTRYGWVVAGPEAYPSIFRKELGLVLRPPLAWELLLMEACLRDPGVRGAAQGR